MKDKKFIYGSIIAVAFLLTAGLTYAYFSLTVSGNDVAQTINVSTTKVELIYTDGNEIKVDGIEPKWTTTKTITVENTGNEEAYYALGWQKLYNEIQKDELVIRSTCTSSGATGGTCDNTDNVVIPQTSEVNAAANKVLHPYKENVLILPGETHTYTVTIEFINYEDKHQNYNQGKRFYGVLGAAESTKKLPTLANYLIDNYSTLGLTKIDQTATGNQNYATTEYRYQGGSGCFNFEMTDELCTSLGGTEVEFNNCRANDNYINLTKDFCVSNGGSWNENTPNNYITFNGEGNAWRIIGVFEVETPNEDGMYIKENKVKIVSDVLGKAAWDFRDRGDYKNDWTTSTLMTMLNNGPYYNRTSGYTKLACSTGYDTTTSETAICNYASNGLTDTAKNQISTTKWYLGNIVMPSDEECGNTKELYTQERGTSVYSGNSQTWDGKVALIYPSDYMYASSACYNDDTMKGRSSDSSKDYRNDTCKSANWLFDVNSWLWTVSPTSFYRSYGALEFTGFGFATSTFVNDHEAIDFRTSVYLDTNVNYVSGDGTIDNPFVIK